MDQIHQLADTKEDLPKLDKDHWVVVNDYGMNTHISPRQKYRSRVMHGLVERRIRLQ